MNQDRPHKGKRPQEHINYHLASARLPTSASLNLTPGQVLPHDFQPQNYPQPGFVSEPAVRNHIYEQPQQTGHEFFRNVEGRRDHGYEREWSNHHINMPPGSSTPLEDSHRRSNRHMSHPVETADRPSVDTAPKQKRRSAPHASSSSNFTTVGEPGGGPVMTGMPLPQHHLSQPQIPPHVPHHEQGGRDNSRQDDRINTGQTSVGHVHRPPDVPHISNFSQHSEPKHDLPPPRQEGGGRDPRYPPTFPVPHYTDANYNAASIGAGIPDGRGGSAHQTVSLQRQSRDGHSSQQSIAGTSTSSHSQNGGRAPQPRHVPKRLVMPTPLQPSQLNAPHNSHPAQTQYLMNNPKQPPQLYAHAPSLPSVPSPAGGPPPPSRGRFTRAQEIPTMLQSKKLQKRSTLGVESFPAMARMDPHIALSFDPALSSFQSPLPVKTKPEKATKKVLSKRRTDL